MIEVKKTLEEPKILSANTFYWESGDSASTRRWREAKRIQEVKDYLSSLGFEVRSDATGVEAFKDDIEILFSYSESCKNVYKHLYIERNGKRSNIRTLRKIAKDFGERSLRMN